MNGHAVAARHEPCDLSDAVEQWMAYIIAQEQWYALLAAAQGEALVPHTPEELRAVAELAAAFGIHPDAVPAHRREQRSHSFAASTRATTLTGVGE